MNGLFTKGRFGSFQSMHEAQGLKALVPSGSTNTGTPQLQKIAELAELGGARNCGTGTETLSLTVDSSPLKVLFTYQKKKTYCLANSF